MLSGKSNAEVARTLLIAISTVKTDTNSIFSKLQVISRTQAIDWRATSTCSRLRLSPRP